MLLVELLELIGSIHAQVRPLLNPRLEVKRKGLCGNGLLCQQDTNEIPAVEHMEAAAYEYDTPRTDKPHNLA